MRLAYRNDWLRNVVQLMCIKLDHIAIISLREIKEREKEKEKKNDIDVSTPFEFYTFAKQSSFFKNVGAIRDIWDEVIPNAARTNEMLWNFMSRHKMTSFPMENRKKLHRHAFPSFECICSQHTRMLLTIEAWIVWPYSQQFRKSTYWIYQRFDMLFHVQASARLHIATVQHKNPNSWHKSHRTNASRSHFRSMRLLALDHVDDWVRIAYFICIAANWQRTEFEWSIELVSADGTRNWSNLNCSDWSDVNQWLIMDFGGRCGLCIRYF